MATFTSASYDGRYLQLSISESVNVAANTSTLTWTLTSAGGSSNYYTMLNGFLLALMMRVK